MKTICILLLATVGISSNAAEKADWPSPNLKCDQSLNGFSLPGKMKPDDLVKILRPEGLAQSANEVELLCQTGTRDWKAGKSQIAIVLTQNFKRLKNGGAESGATHLSIATVKTTDDHIEIMASLPKTLEIQKAPGGLDDDSDTTPEEVQGFDLAAYKMTDDHFAFGLRTVVQVMYSGGGRTTEFLRLFHIDGKTIKQILGPLEMHSSESLAGDWHDDGTRDHENSDSGRTIIKSLKTKTNAMYDLEAISKEGKKTVKTVYKWNGDSYQ